MPVVAAIMMAAALAQAGGLPGDEPGNPDEAAVANFGKSLFFDKSLSKNRTQACATCHDPSRAFTDNRDGGVAGAVSLGDDGKSLGDRNTPSTAYVALTPDFHRDDSGQFSGGFFLDGRATTLIQQTTEPLLNPLEMALTDTAEIVARVAENPDYVRTMNSLFGKSIFDDTGRAHMAIIKSIATFERSDFFSPFDSKYDRYLRGEYTLSPDEDLGRSLFFSGLTNCAKCHLNQRYVVSQRETFTNYRFHNIGIPANRTVRSLNGLGQDYRDRGLANHPGVDPTGHAGKFKVPTLRNVAVTGPYMHNGVFKSLHTAVLYYGKFTVRNSPSDTNPETGEPWDNAEFEATIELALLREGQPLNQARANVIVAFLKTLTDRRYEHLLD